MPVLPFLNTALLQSFPVFCSYFYKRLKNIEAKRNIEPLYHTGVFLHLLQGAKKLYTLLYLLYTSLPPPPPPPINTLWVNAFVTIGIPFNKRHLSIWGLILRFFCLSIILYYFIFKLILFSFCIAYMFSLVETPHLPKKIHCGYTMPPETPSSEFR